MWRKMTLLWSTRHLRASSKCGVIPADIRITTEVINAPRSPQPLHLAIDDIDISDPTLYATDSWPAYFERLRAEDPVHWTQNQQFGGFWSITRFDDIVTVDKNHQLFSSEPAITIGDYGEDLPVRQFIAMDPPLHDVQRKAVQGWLRPATWLIWSPSLESELLIFLRACPLASLSIGSKKFR